MLMLLHIKGALLHLACSEDSFQGQFPDKECRVINKSSLEDMD